MITFIKAKFNRKALNRTRVVMSIGSATMILCLKPESLTQCFTIKQGWKHPIKQSLIEHNINIQTNITRISSESMILCLKTENLTQCFTIKHGCQHPEK